MEFLPRELKAKFDSMTPEEQAEFLEKRAAALSVADSSPKVFEVGSGGAMEEKETSEQDLEERTSEKQTF